MNYYQEHTCHMLFESQYIVGRTDKVQSRCWQEESSPSMLGMLQPKDHSSNIWWQQQQTREQAIEEGVQKGTISEGSIKWNKEAAQDNLDAAKKCLICL